MAIGGVLFLLWLAAIWNKPSHRDIKDCECGESHDAESLVSDTLYAMSGLWLIAGWNTTQCHRRAD